MTDEEELVKQLHELADWIEKHNSVHCHSVPRKAAYTIEKLLEENQIYRLQLNKKYLSMRDIIDRYIGDVRYLIYRIKKKIKKK